jgi:hypothetical protein
MSAFPDHFINPKDKGEEWLIEMISAIHGEWGSQSHRSFEKGSERYRENMLYALGKQSTEKYKPIFELSNDPNKSYVNLDFRPPAFLTKLMRITNNRFSKVNWTVNAEAIDPYALDEKDDYEAKEKANIAVRDLLTELGVDTAVLNSGEQDQPQDEEELSIKMEFGYKHNQAIDVEKKVDTVFTHEHLKEKLTVIRNNGFTSGIWAARISTDPITGKVTIRVVDPKNLVISPTNDPFGRDIWYAGEIILVTIDEIRRGLIENGTDFSEELLEQLAYRNANINGNPRHFQSNSYTAYAYDSCKIPVFDCEFLSCDKYWYEQRWDKRGNKVIGKVAQPEERNDRVYYSDERSVVYRGKLIPGTKILYDYGLKSDMPLRRDGNNFEAMLSFKVICPELNEMETNPIIENLIPHVDQAVITWIKLQNVIARARPKGIMIEIGALENINLGASGEDAMQPIDILDMFSQTGILVYRKIAMDGSNASYKSIEELDNGLGSEAAEYFNVLTTLIQQMKDMIGFNEMTDGTTPDAKMLNGVASLAAEGTNNALHHLMVAERSMIEQIAEEVTIRVHDSIALKKDSPYRYVLGSELVKSIGERSNMAHRQFSIAIEYDSDEADKQKFEMRVQRELDSGRINLGDAVTVERCRNRKQAEQILAYRIKKNMMQMQAQKQQEMLTNAQAQAQAATVAEEEKRKTLQIQAQLKLMEIEAMKAKETDLLILQYALQGTLDDGTQQSKQNIAKMTADATKEVAKIKANLKVKSVPTVPKKAKK